MHTSEDLYWLAGLLEGEGSFLSRRIHTGHLQISIVMSMADEDIVRRAQAIGGGRVLGPYDRGQGKYRPNKVQWMWHLSRMKEAIALMQCLRPIMGVRRQEQIDTCLAAYAKKQEVAPSDRTHCPAGHPYNADNTYLHNRGNGRTARQCRACRRERMRQYKAAKRAQAEG